MELEEDLDNKRFFNNVRKVVKREYTFDEQLEKYNDTPIAVETSMYNQNGKITSFSVRYFKGYQELMGYDLSDSNVEYFYNDIDLLKKIISYDEGSRIDGITEYFYNDDNALSLVKVDRITSYQTIEYEYSDNRIVTTLVDSVVGEVKKDVIIYDNLKRVISEESIFKKIPGNYPVKNTLKKYYYDIDSYLTEHYWKNKIISKETKLLDGKLIKRINYKEDGSIFSIIEFYYVDNMITTIHRGPDGKQNFKTIAYFDNNYNCIKKMKFNNSDELEDTIEAVFNYDEFNNCIYEEVIRYERCIIEYEYQ